MEVKQFFVEGWDKNFSYLIFDPTSHQGLLVDPNGKMDDLLEFIEHHKIQIRYIINTHSHGDHTEHNEGMKKKFQVPIVGHQDEPYDKDIALQDGETWGLGKGRLKFLHTPGHTPGSLCILTDGKLVTGDTLFVGRSGKTKFPGGSAEDMYQSMVRLRSLPDSTIIFPGHDYGQWPTSTIGKEKEYNPCLMASSLEEFRSLGI